MHRVVVLFTTFIILIQGWSAFAPWDTSDFFSYYVELLIVLFFYVVCIPGSSPETSYLESARIKNADKGHNRHGAPSSASGSQWYHSRAWISTPTRSGTRRQDSKIISALLVRKRRPNGWYQSRYVQLACTPSFIILGCVLTCLTLGLCPCADDAKIALETPCRAMDILDFLGRPVWVPGREPVICILERS